MPNKIHILTGIFLLGNLVFSQDLSENNYAFLQSIESKEKVDDYFIKECKQFVETFSYSANAPDVLRMIADKYHHKGDKALALSFYLKNLFFYPETASRDTTLKSFLFLIEQEREFRNKREDLLQLITGKNGNASFADRNLRFLKSLIYLFESGLAKLDQAIVDESHNFHKTYPDDNRRDSLTVWIADLYLKTGNEREAFYEFEKIEYLFPESKFLDYSRFQRAEIYYRKLNEPGHAMQLYADVVTKSPESEHAAKAQFLVAEIQEQKLDAYEDAIAVYQLVIDNFTDIQLGVLAFQRIAAIYERRLRQPEKIIDAYLALAELYPTHADAPTGLLEAAKVCEKKLENYQRAADLYAKLADDFPRHEQAPEALIQAGDLVSRYLENYVQAQKFYTMFIEKYPDHKKTREAQSKLRKAASRQAEQTINKTTEQTAEEHE